MPYLIDASNLGGVLGGRAGSRDAEGVVRRLLAWRRRGRVVAVFDGEPDPRIADRYGSLEIVWSGAGRTADAEILRRLAAGRNWTVVTDDRELAARCRLSAVRVLGATELLDGGLRAPAAPTESEGDDKPAAGVDRDHWEEIFRDRR